MPPRPRNRPPTPRQGGDFAGLRAALIGFIRDRAGETPRHLLGRRQVVRHWILIPAFEGSIPSAPANQSGL